MKLLVGEIKRIIKLKERILEYSMHHPTDARASEILKECNYDIAHNRVLDVYNYELRMDALEVGERDD